MTRRLADWVGQQAVKRTFASIAEEVGMVEGTVRSDDVMGMELVDMLAVEKHAKAPHGRTGSTDELKNFGVDISTLARLIESGEI